MAKKVTGKVLTAKREAVAAIVKELGRKANAAAVEAHPSYDLKKFGKVAGPMLGAARNTKKVGNKTVRVVKYADKPAKNGITKARARAAMAALDGHAANGSLTTVNRLQKLVAAVPEIPEYKLAEVLRILSE